MKTEVAAERNYTTVLDLYLTDDWQPAGSGIHKALVPGIHSPADIFLAEYHVNIIDAVLQWRTHIVAGLVALDLVQSDPLRFPVIGERFKKSLHHGLLVGKVTAREVPVGITVDGTVGKVVLHIHREHPEKIHPLVR